MPSILIVLCVLCETPSASVLSKSAVQNPCCMPCCLFFSPFPPSFVGQFKPSVGSQALGHPWGDAHGRELPSPPDPSGERQRGKNDRKRNEKHQQELLSYSFWGISQAPFCFSFLFTWGSKTAPQKGGAGEFGNGSVGMAGNMDSWISPLFV